MPSPWTTGRDANYCMVFLSLWTLDLSTSSFPHFRHPQNDFSPSLSLSQVCDRENYEFTKKVFEKSGIGRLGSYLPRESFFSFFFLYPFYSPPAARRRCLGKSLLPLTLPSLALFFLLQTSSSFPKPAWLNPTTTAKLGVQPKNDLDSAAEEARIVMVSLAKDALARAGLEAADVDVLITSSTVFSPVPSLASMVVNALGMREDVQAYNLGGMGCR